MEIEIGRPGRFTSRAGKEYEFTASDLAEIAEGYDPAKFDAPLCVGHPDTDSPAYGWAKSLRFDGQRLLATPRAVDPGFAQIVNEEKFKKISPAFWPPNHPLNPTKGKWSLRHVGFLGAHPPAITGLKPAHFAAGDDGVVIIEFAFQQEEIMKDTSGTDPNGAIGADPESIKKELKKEIRKGFEQGAEFAARENQLDEREKRNEEREKRIEAREAQIRTDEITEFAAGLIKEGQLLAPEQDGLVAFMAALNDDETI